jgi:hypothetical protein
MKALCIIYIHKSTLNQGQIRGDSLGDGLTRTIQLSGVGVHRLVLLGLEHTHLYMLTPSPAHFSFLTSRKCLTHLLYFTPVSFFFFWFLYSFTHMCIHCLGHLSPSHQLISSFEHDFFLFIFFYSYVHTWAWLLNRACLMWRSSLTCWVERSYQDAGL